jgi:hypothetical protein
VAEHGLAVGGESAWPRRHARPSLVPLPTPPEPPKEEREESAELYALTELLVTLLVKWVDRAHDHQVTRRAAGLPAIDTTWENAIVDQYAARLGRDGAEIAVALLGRSRPGRPE